MIAAVMTMMASVTKMIDNVPWTVVFRTTAAMASGVFAVPWLVFPAAMASRNSWFCAQ